MPRTYCKRVFAAAAAISSINCAKPEPDRIPETPIPRIVQDATPLDSRPLVLEDYVSRALKSPRIVVIGDSIMTGYSGLVAGRLGEAAGEVQVKDVTKGGQLVDGWIGRQFDMILSGPENVIVLQGGV
ncbi:MAG: hypothetical protein AB1529_01580, partial [Candidatus Micrarchaeota archaeon]